MAVTRTDAHSTRIHRAPIRALTTLVSVAVPILAAAWAHAAAEAPEPARQQTLATLDRIAASGGPSIGLEVHIDRADASRGSDFRVGDEFRYRFRARRPTHLTVFHVDSQGLTTVLYPGAVDPDSAIAADEDKVFPVDLSVQPPLGREDLVVVATPDPITLDHLGLVLAPGEPVVQVESTRSPALAERLRAHLEDVEPSRIAVTQVAMRVEGRGDVPLTAQDIITFWTTRTRSVEVTRLDLPVEFATGSADLDSDARRILDEMGTALNAPSLARQRVEVGGHTDDVGTPEFNQALSERRAVAVRDYLVEVHGVGAERLQTRGYGESAPKQSGIDPASRQENRRVEFKAAR